MGLRGVFTKTVCLLLILGGLPSVSAALETRFTSELRGGAVMFYEDEFEDFFGEEFFPMGRYVMGVSMIPNLELNLSVGGMFLEGDALGQEAGDESGEEFEFWIVPVQLGLTYRFDFTEEQLLVPWITGGGDYWFFGEDNEFEDDVKGDKTGYHAGGGVAILLDALEPPAAKRMENLWGVHDTFITISGEWTQMTDEDEGIDFSNVQYSGGLMFVF